jgi:hypothetical protein
MEPNKYDVNALNRNLLPPPRIQPFVENWPIIEPPFRGQIPPHVQDAEEWEDVDSNQVRDDELMIVTDETLARVREGVLRNERLQRLLTDKRYIALGASLREDKNPDSSSLILFILYSYSENKVIEVTLDRSSLEITDISTARYQPSPVQEEINQAIAIARLHEKLADQLTDDLIGMAILVTEDDPQNPLHNHRLFDIRFGCPDQRLPKYWALVDLSTEKVIGAGSLNERCGGGEHE